MKIPNRLWWLLATVASISMAQNLETMENHPERPMLQDGKYLIYFPDSGRREEDFMISASIFNATKGTHLTIELLETKNNSVVSSAEYDINSEETKLLKLPVPFLTGYSYRLAVNGTGGVVFSDTTYVYFSHNRPANTNHHIFVQTDKPLYKPLDKIRFRVFGIHADLRAAKAPMNITVIDPNKNIMYRWFDETPETGVSSHVYELSDQPVLGDWTIKIDQHDMKKRHIVEVREYVLPNYKVEIHGDKTIPTLGHGYLFIADNTIKVHVSAKYTFGKSVRGKLMMNATVDDRYDGLTINFTKEIDGDLDIEFDINDFKKAGSVKVSRYQSFCTPKKIKFRAVVVEALTGKKMSAEPFSIEFVNDPIKIDIDAPIIYKRGLPKKVKVQITRFDGKDLTEDDRKLPVEILTKHGNGLMHKTEYPIPQNGTILFDFLMPANREGSVTIEVTYRGLLNGNKYEVTEMAYPNEFYNNHDDNIEARLVQERVNVGDDITVHINSTTPISWAIITTVSGEKIFDSKMVPIEKKTEFVLEVPSSEAMIPSANVLISCITSEGKLMADASTAKIIINFENEVVGTFTEDEGQPGSNVDFKVKTMPGSAVFVMAVDKKLHLLEEAEYITEDMVYDAIVGRDTSNSWRRNVRNIPDILRLVDLNLITNYIEKPLRRMHYSVDARVFDGDGRGPLMTVQHSPMGIRPEAVNIAPLQRIRKFFPETWIWQDGVAADSGEYTFSKIVPDSITMWQTNAFAFHPEKGLGIMKEPVDFLSHQDFFVHPILPYSLIRGESFVLRVSIFSNLTEDQEVTVTLSESAQYTLNGSGFFKKVMVPAHKDNSVSFEVVPTEVGNIPIKIEAQCAMAADEVHKSILVKPEGYTQYKNKAFLLKVADETPVEIDYEIKDRPEIVPDSERVEVSVIGDLMGPTIDSLGNLVRIPTGCGEQNMINFAPNVYIYNYLNATSKLTPELKKMIEKYTIRGFKNQMKYQRNDGSYSAFGKRDSEGSTWLTAFVLRCFGQARKRMPSVYIDEEILVDGIGWLVRRYGKKNLFEERGRVIHSAMQGGASKGVALTTYVLISLCENSNILSNLTKPIMDEVVANLEIDETDTYSLGMLMYLMALIKNTDKFNTIEKVLEAKAITEDDMKYWKLEDKTEEGDYHHSASTGIELSSYILLAYTQQGMIEKGIPVMKWLMSQRNSLGGFHSTQDTILGLEALSLFAAQVKSPASLRVTFTVGDSTSYEFPEITPLISTILHKHVMPADATKISIKSVGKPAEGAAHSYALAQISWQYNVKFGSKDEIFEAKVEYRSISPADMELHICHRMKEMNITGMIIIEAALPSGNSLTNRRELNTEENISKVELDDSKVILYLKKMDTNFSCYTLKASKVYEIHGHLSPLPVKIRLYYQPDLELVTMYQITGGSE